MPTIRVDEEVYGALQRFAEAFVDSPNTVLRRLLELDTPVAKAVAPRDPEREPALLMYLNAGLIHAPEVLVWERPNRDEVHLAMVEKDGWVHTSDGERFLTPSAAAKHVSGTESNGWRVWTMRRNGQSLDSVRSAFDKLPRETGQSNADARVYYLRSGDTSASAVLSGTNGLRLIEARSRLSIHESLPESRRAFRNKVIAAGYFGAPLNGIYELARPLELKSPSAASTLLLGHESNGRLLWRNRQGVPLGRA